MNSAESGLPSQNPEREIGSPLSPRPEWSPRISWLILALLCSLFIATSFTPSIFDANEGLYAGAVREMSHSGNWLEPTNHGFLRVQKPPLIYWFFLASTSIFGLNEFALRLPTALAVSGWIIAIYLIMRRLGGERLGLTAALILSTILGMRVFAFSLQPEPFLAVFTSLSLWCLVEARFALLARTEPGSTARFSPNFWYQLMWFFMAMGTLSKGVHGALWPLGGVILTALFFPRTRPWLAGVASLRGAILFFLVVSPWYIYMSCRWPGFLAEHFFNEQVRASVTYRFPQLYPRWAPLHLFYLHQFYALLPWSFALPAAFFGSGECWNRLTGHGKEIVYFLSVTFILEVLSLSFSTRLTYYGVSSWGIAAGLLALPWRQGLEWKHPVARILLFIPILALLTTGAFFIYLSCRYAFHPPIPATQGVRDSYFFAIFLSAPSLATVPVLWTSLFAVTLFVPGCLAAWYWSRHRSLSTMGSIAISMVLLSLLMTWSITKISPFFSLAGAAKVINRSMMTQPGAVVFYDGDPINASSFLYYLRAPLKYVNGDVENEYAQRVLHQGLDDYMPEDKFLKLWNSPAPLFLVLNDSRCKHWTPLFKSPPREIFRAGNEVIYTNFNSTLSSAE